uniref:WSC domain-containing protein n=1 Tax=Macrostomum lignano TaxID=282301 RepID=A0A1I8J083_9PLAT
MTVGKCYNLCRKLKYRFFGVQYASQCWCGNHYGRYGLRDKNECRMQCSGDKTTYCGAGWRNDIFTTGLSARPKDSAYLGCFIDNAARDLPKVVNAGVKANSHYCIKLCKRAGYKYAGLQYASYCTCGNSYGSLGRVSNKQCKMTCKGDRREKCGGPWRNSVYSTGLKTRKVSTPGLKYLGCFVDKATRDLRREAPKGHMSVPKCYRFCRKHKYKFFGVQYGNHCFCGNHYGRFGIRPNTECRMQCSGDKTTYCGAGWRNSVYATGLELATTGAGVRKLGCYVDKAKRDLPHLYAAGHKTNKAFCWRYCKGKGYKYFGLQFGNHCTCGNTYGRYGKAKASSCSAVCKGDRRRKCGGTWRNEIFTTGLRSKKAKRMLHLGCFVDSKARDLPKLAGKGRMTVGKCYNLCRKLKYRFFGVQYASQCWCGNHYGRYGLRDKNECRMQCSGDKTTYCGAGWRNDIFTTGLSARPKDSAYLGCFIDNAARDLPKVVNAGVKANSHYCIKLCKRAGYKYAGLQYASYCTCGNSYGSLGRVSNKQCKMTCKGDRREKCGGPWRNSVYSTGLKTRKASTPGMKYLGCFVDSSKRDLRREAPRGHMSVPKCYRFCRKHKYKFFGVQYSNHCFCGNHYGRFGIRPNTECRMQCSGDKTTYCGGGWRNNVYTTGLEVATIAKGVRRLGCFVDNAKRDLPLVHNAGHKASKPYCWKFCKSRGYVYFGLQNGNHCTCGNNYGAFGRAKKSSCRKPCRGDKRSKCGGAYRNEVFTTGIELERPSAPGMKHMGCFVDSRKRDLPKLAATGDMSVLKCRLKCKRLGYRYFGVQFAKQCWCGNSYGKHGKRSQIECRMQCTGDKANYCGNSWRNDIYSTGIELEASTCRLGTKEKFVPYRTCSCKPAPDHRSLGSLVFVIDTTGSMGRVIKSVKNNIRKIIAANKRFDDFVVATFGDPYKKKLMKTTSASKIYRFLNKLKARGGGDCPEFAMSGALDAAEAAEPNSVMILFTDASAKDRRKMGAVEAKLKAKRIRFFTVASGRQCGTNGKNFAKLAKVTYGQFSRLHSKVSNKVMELIRRGVRGDLSFSAFPSSRGGLTRVLKGKCPCRTVTRRICVKPHPGFLGCYLDDPEYPDFTVAMVSNRMTVWKCNKICKAKKFSYFGVKNGKICGCGNQYGNSGDTANANCNVACGGNPGEKCGGNSNNSVFESEILHPIVVTKEMESGTKTQQTGQQEAAYLRQCLESQTIDYLLSKPACFNLLAIGEDGLGKVTFLETLFGVRAAGLREDKDRAVAVTAGADPSREFPVSVLKEKLCLGDSSSTIESLNESQTQQQQQQQQQSFLSGNNRRLTVRLMSTVNYTVGESNRSPWTSVADFLAKQVTSYVNTRAVNQFDFRPEEDERVHCCLYFLPPIGGRGLRRCDALALKYLEDKVNLVPVLAKADSYTADELNDRKSAVAADLQRFGIAVHQFLLPIQQQLQQQQQAPQPGQRVLPSPLAVIGAPHPETSRTLPWGSSVSVEDDRYSDVAAVRRLIVERNMLSKLPATLPRK